ncbi:MAG: DHH family phosphoesterase [Clostridia bacterium]|nr:DHH family phosphoesterase [Clostridia bacterium]
MNNIRLDAAASLIAEKRSILILTHIHPDGDTLGSAFGLKWALEGFCRAEIICADTIPDRLKFITDGQTDLREERLGDFSPEMIMSVDVAELHLMGTYGGNYSGAIDLKLDHHRDGAEYARYNYVDSSAAAAGEIIYRLIRELEALGAAKLTPKCATALFAAVSSDTGSFRFTNTNAESMRIAASLMEAGADTEDVNRRLYESKSANEIVAQKLTLNGMNVCRGGSVVVFSITNKMKKENGLADDDFGGVIDIIRAIDGVDLAVTIRQMDDDPEKFRISMRSSGDIYANRLCAMFEGGGHARAAGGTVYAESPESAEYTVISKILSEIGYEA